MHSRIAFLLVPAMMGAWIGCAQSTAPPPAPADGLEQPTAMTVRFHIAIGEARSGWREVKDEAGRPVWLSPDAVLTEADVVAAEALHGAARSIVRVRFNGVGADRLRQATAQNVGKHLAILINDRFLTAALIQGEIPGGLAHIDGRFSPQRAAEIAESLNPD